MRKRINENYFQKSVALCRISILPALSESQIQRVRALPFLSLIDVNTHLNKRLRVVLNHWEKIKNNPEGGESFGPEKQSSASLPRQASASSSREARDSTKERRDEYGMLSRPRGGVTRSVDFENSRPLKRFSVSSKYYPSEEDESQNVAQYVQSGSTTTSQSTRNLFRTTPVDAEDKVPEGDNNGEAAEEVSRGGFEGSGISEDSNQNNTLPRTAGRAVKNTEYQDEAARLETQSPNPSNKSARDGSVRIANQTKFLSQTQSSIPKEEMRTKSLSRPQSSVPREEAQTKALSRPQSSISKDEAARTKALPRSQSYILREESQTKYFSRPQSSIPREKTQPKALSRSQSSILKQEMRTKSLSRPQSSIPREETQRSQYLTRAESNGSEYFSTNGSRDSIGISEKVLSRRASGSEVYTHARQRSSQISTDKSSGYGFDHNSLGNLEESEEHLESPEEYGPLSVLLSLLEASGTSNNFGTVSTTKGHRRLSSRNIQDLENNISHRGSPIVSKAVRLGDGVQTEALQQTLDTSISKQGSITRISQRPASSHGRGRDLGEHDRRVSGHNASPSQSIADKNDTELTSGDSISESYAIVKPHHENEETSDYEKNYVEGKAVKVSQKLPAISGSHRRAPSQNSIILLPKEDRDEISKTEVDRKDSKGVPAAKKVALAQLQKYSPNTDLKSPATTLKKLPAVLKEKYQTISQKDDSRMISLNDRVGTTDSQELYPSDSKPGSRRESDHNSEGSSSVKAGRKVTSNGNLLSKKVKFGKDRPFPERQISSRAQSREPLRKARSTDSLKGSSRQNIGADSDEYAQEMYSLFPDELQKSLNSSTFTQPESQRQDIWRPIGSLRGEQLEDLKRRRNYFLILNFREECKVCDTKRRA